MSTTMARPDRIVVTTAAFAVMAAVIATLIATQHLPHALGLPWPAAMAVLALLVATPLLLRHWMLALVVFLAWLMVEDLIRKLAGNDIRVYFVKDLFYIVTLAAVMLAPGVRGAWRSATPQARLPLYALLAWALVMSIPTGLADIRTPLLGLRLDFLYLPLVVCGYLAAREAGRMGTLLLSASVLGGAASLLGIIQAVIGPAFLAPDRPTPGLINLILVRGSQTPGGVVYRPTGMFVDPGRFDAMAVTTLAVSLAAIYVLRGPKRWVAIAAALSAAGATWVSGGRTGLLEGAAVAAVFLILLLRSASRTFLMIAGAAFLVAVAVVLVGALLEPRLVVNRFNWYLATLNPMSSQNEWSFRWTYFGGNFLKGVHIGGWFGLGTGHEALGKQYVFGGHLNSPEGLYLVEGGYASVVVEWGLVGLALWLAWSVGWVRELWWRLRHTFDSGDRAAGWVLFSWVMISLFFLFVPGLQGFQNYTTNAYLWLLSGVVFGLSRTHRDAVSAEQPTRRHIWVTSPEIRRDGGTEYCVAEQLDRWRDRYRMRLYTMRVSDFDTTGIELRRIPWLPGPLLIRYIWWFVANGFLRRIDADRLGPSDVVYSPGVNNFGASAIGVHMVFAKNWDRIRKEMSGVRGMRRLHRAIYWSLIRALESYVYRGAALVWAVSRADARDIERRFNRPEGTVPVVAHGVDSLRFSPVERRRRRARARKRLELADQFVCLLVGNDAHKKGVDVAIQALWQLPERVVLAVAGNVDSDEVLRWGKAARVSHRVKLWPHSTDVVDYYAAADALVAPSREDSFHMPALEALSCGLPVVLSTEAGAADLTEDGRHALLLRRPGDSSELAEAVRRVLEDAGLVQRLVKNGRALAERNTWANNASQVADLVAREITTPRTLVFATDPWGVGGIQRMTRYLIQSLSELYGPERTGVLAVWDHGGETHAPCRELHSGLPMNHSVPAGVGLAQRLSYALAAVVSALRWRHPHLVIIAAHSHLAPVAMIAAAVANRPYAVWCHGKESWGRLPFLVRVALRHATVLFAPTAYSARLAESAAGLSPGTVRVVPHGLEFSASLSKPKRRASSSVLTVARLDPEDAYKGIDSLLCAWPLVVARAPNARLTVIGDGPDMQRLLRIAAALDLNGSVQFAGRVSDSELSDAYAGAAVFALASRYSTGSQPQGEGFGLVFIEAAAAGLPVVAGRGAGTDEAVRDGETGILVDPEDPVALSAAIVRLLRDVKLARRMGVLGQEHAESFMLSAFARSVEGVVQSLSAVA
jgi:phosphatidylinositol alpha-1,6-mannosyltransferase